MLNKIKLFKRDSLQNKSVLNLIFCALLATFWVIFIWNFWQKGVYALGLNAFIFLLFFTGLFIRRLSEKTGSLKKDLIWLVPFILIITSFLIYDNPFLKIISSFLVLPAFFIIFYNYAFLKDKEKKFWNFNFFITLVKRFFSIFPELGKTLMTYLEIIIPARADKRKIIAKVILGLILFFIIAFVVFIPLLSSADIMFAGKMEALLNWLKETFSVPLVYKITTFMVLSVLFSSMLFAWGREHDYQTKAEAGKNLDPIIPGIVLGGILVLYLLFLWIQFERLWIGTLPFDFKETENLVKSGFWQLFFLSIINIVLYFFTYKKTNTFVQRILTFFTITSLLLLASAAYRMGLYVIYYGFSYEKFFASYTVLFCAILFSWLISRMFIRQRADIIKFIVFLFIWLYAILTVFPVEQFILSANVRLAEKDQSKIILYELTMLSPDALSLVKDYQSRGLLKERDDYLDREGLEKIDQTFDWQSWINKQEKIVLDKKWYERNIMNMLYLSN